MLSKLFKNISYGLSTALIGTYTASNYQIYHELQKQYPTIKPSLKLSNYAHQVHQKDNGVSQIDINLLPLENAPVKYNYIVRNDHWELRILDPKASEWVFRYLQSFDKK